jgi:hypothetical protein
MSHRASASDLLAMDVRPSRSPTPMPLLRSMSTCAPVNPPYKKNKWITGSGYHLQWRCVLEPPPTGNSWNLRRRGTWEPWWRCGDVPPDIGVVATQRQNPHGVTLGRGRGTPPYDLDRAWGGRGPPKDTRGGRSLTTRACASRPSKYVSVINDNHLISLMNFIEAKENWGPYIKIHQQSDFKWSIFED